MPASRIEIAFPSPGWLFGVRGIDVLVDGENVGRVRFGETKTVECAPGPHKVQAVLKAIFSRHSNALDVEVPADEAARVSGVYSRTFGTIELKSA